MKLKFIFSAFIVCSASAAFAQSGAELFVTSYAKLPKSYDSAQFQGKAVGEYGGCQLSISAGYMNDGMKYLQLANDLGEAVFVSLDSTKSYPGNVIKISQGDEEGDEFGHRYPITNKLKLTVDDNGKPVKAEGKIDRQFPYRDSKIICVLKDSI